MPAAPARHPARPVVAGLAALALLAGCSHGAKAPTASGTTSGKPASTATTSAPRPAVFPFTGMLVGSATAAAARPALSIKVENTPPARPQAGLNTADVIAEELVEGGITRFFVTFQSHDSLQVGPVRSARPVDAALLRQLGGGLFAYAGAAEGEIAPVKAYSNAVLLSPDQAPGAYWRSAGRPAPHNLYTSTARLYAAAARLGARRGPPPALFSFTQRAPVGHSPVRAVTVPFSPVADYVASWRWDAKAGLWDRYQGGQRATTDGGAGVTAANVVVMGVKVGTIPGLVDSLGHPDPNVIVVGQGACWVFRDGRVLEGTWRRAAVGQVMQLMDRGGHIIPLQPGRTWIELEPVGYTPQARLGLTQAGPTSPPPDHAPSPPLAAAVLSAFPRGACFAGLGARRLDGTDGVGGEVFHDLSGDGGGRRGPVARLVHRHGHGVACLAGGCQAREPGTRLVPGDARRAALASDRQRAEREALKGRGRRSRRLPPAAAA
jgi:Protein of unknown function (DUF3048) N-terminal domain/Protein of unknown function (DUF3048) C-terminal domain